MEIVTYFGFNERIDSMPTWTPQQQTAIDATGGGLLVSAAAGSGKTAVLTERITARILDREHPADADKFLVVTFTRAAAAEMRGRIRARLRAALAENPGDTFLQRQMMLLSQAKICTMDSFFHALVRENFERLGLSPSLRGVDDAMLSKMKAEVLRTLLEEQYMMAEAGENEDFAELTGYFGIENDQALSAEILSLYGKLRSLPFPERWMERQLSLYEAAGTGPEETQWGQAILHKVHQLIRGAEKLMEKAVEGALPVSGAALCSGKVLAMLQEELDGIRALREGALSWDSLYGAPERIFAGHRLTFLKGAPPVMKDAVKDCRSTAKDLLTQAGELLICRSEEFQQDLSAERRVIRSFFSLVTDFSERLDAAKKAAGVADFNDFAAFALKLVANPDGTPTAYGKELSGQFEEIMLDEYQDTNRLQDMIFRCISKDGANLFYVGDLKQSIYRFRSANPAVFLEKKESFAPYDGKAFPALCVLSQNFRSRREITQAANFLFSCVMSRAVGDVDYDENEALHCGAAYYPPLPAGQATVTLQLIDGAAAAEEEEQTESPDEEPVSVYLLEARALAVEIGRMIAEGESVYDKGNSALRPCRGGDFVILMRSVRGLDTLYAEALHQLGVDAQLCTTSGYFGSREVSLMTALLQTLDNPTRDTELAAVLLSPVFSFDCDDLARLAIEGKGGSLYRSLIREAASGSAHAAKAGSFLELFHRLRAKSAVTRISTLIQYIYDQTDFIEVMSRASGAGVRESNLRLLLKYAADYETGGSSELAGFVSYLNALAEQQQDFKAAVPLAEAENAVRIMTIHRSKGLEFPIVAVAGCSKRFNAQDLTGMTVFHPELGFGMRRVERAQLRRYQTLPYAAIAAREREDMVSEELRLLYVAVTRAKERLILCVSEKNLGRKLKSISGMYAGQSPDGRLPEVSSARCQSYGDWILAAFLRHPGMSAVREAYGLEDPPLIKADFPLRVLCPKGRESPKAEPDTQPAGSDPEAVAMLRRRFDWTYPDSAATRIPAKLSVTRITHTDKRIRLSAPQFLSGGRYQLLSEECGGDEVQLEKRGAEPGRSDTPFTPAQQGTIFHRALQFADYALGAQDPEGELRRLIERQYLTPAEAETIDREEFAAFFHSGLMERMLAADQVLREYKFFDTIPAAEAGFPEGGEREILLQGIADCIFIEKGKIWLVDYKTDRIGSMRTLADRYAAQLALYRRAILRQPRFAGLAFGGSLLYSTKLGQYIAAG